MFWFPTIILEEGQALCFCLISLLIDTLPPVP
jgi:hypothetical protein